MKNASVAVSKLRKVVLSRSVNFSAVNELWSKIEPEFENLNGPDLVSATFSMHMIGRKFPLEDDGKMLFLKLTQASQKSISQMTVSDLSKFLFAYGFLVREFGTTLTPPVDHTRTVDLVVGQILSESGTAVIPSDCIMRIVKGVHLCRITVSEKLIELFNRVDIDTLKKMDEKVFVVRAMMDYGLFDDGKFLRILEQVIDSDLSASSAASLLYCCAMASFGAEKFKEPLMQVFHKCDISPTNPKSLIPLWSFEILGLLTSEMKRMDNIQEIVEAGLVSNDMRDVEMAITVNEQKCDKARTALKQSIKHQKIILGLQNEYGPLVNEYAIDSRIVVDAATLDKKIAFEIDGPSHYIFHTKTRCKILNGPSNYKQKQLADLGWDVIRISV